MYVAVSNAKAKLSELVRRAEAGEEVVLTRRGRPAVRLVPAVAEAGADERRARRRAMLEALRGCARDVPEFQGVDAAHVTDFLYDENGLPA